MSTKHFFNDDSVCSDSTEDFAGIFFSSSSRDRSSVGSIPWAEDAIKDNKDEWERLERMFYGEESLPDNQQLRDEILDWQRAFPHLRVIGKAIKIPSLMQSNTWTNVNEKEMLVVTPVFQKDVTENTPNLNSNESNSQLTNISNIRDLMDKNLRIRSVPMLSRRRELLEEHTKTELAIDKEKPIQNNSVISKKLSPKSSRNKLRRRNLEPSNSSNSFFSDDSPNSNNVNTTGSAKIVRMPTIVNFIFPHRNSELSKVYVAPSTSSKKKQRHLVLPTLNINRFDLSNDVGRSISAANSQRTINSPYLPNSASTFKNI